ncbi:unnamed protein product, partial [marine sediment metagenome]
HFTKIFGYTLKEIKGKNIDEGMIYPADRIEEGKRFTQKVLNGFLEHETIRKKKNGTLFPVIISANPVIIDKKPQGTVVLYKDITERKQSEQLNTVLYNISKAANSDISLNQLYSLIHQELNNIIDATNFFIALVDVEKDEMSFPYHRDEKDNDFTTRRLSRAKNLTAYIIRSVQSLLVNQKQIEKMADEGDIKLESVGIVTADTHWLGVPLRIKNKTIGAMVVQGYISPHLFSKKDIQLMEFVSSQIATTIQRKQMEEEMEKLAHFD